MSTKYITDLVHFSEPVQLRAEIESYFLQRIEEPQTPLGYKLSFSMGDRWLSQRDYPHGAARVLLDSGVLDDPLTIALRAQTTPGRDKGLLRVVLAAAPTTALQEAIIVDADRSLPETMALWSLPEEQIGISLGDLWFPAGEKVFAPVPAGPDHAERFAEFDAACREVFDRILYGNPAEEVERLLTEVGDEGTN
jgi:hypothetical protein